jgi:adenosylhomocysteine nucleosidase
MDHTLFVCGMKTEAEILREYDVPIVISGGDPGNLQQQLGAFSRYSTNYHSVVSFGIAGGLNPNMKPGALITDPIKELGTDSLSIITSHDKVEAWVRTGCDGVDMESLIASAWAKDHGLEFKVVRAIADPAQFTLPPAALLPLKQDGSPDYWSVLKSIISNPGQILDLMRLNHYTNTALVELAEWCCSNQLE